MRALTVCSAVVAATALLAACREGAGLQPTGALDSRLSGAWVYAPVTPGGGGSFISLNAAGGSITGSGRSYRLCCYYDSFIIIGQYSDSLRSVELAIHYWKGSTATFVGRVQAESLAGVWTVGTPPTATPLVFVRQIAPACADPAPLNGSFDPAAPDFLVMFHDSVDASVEAARLAQTYGFSTNFVWESAPKGFSAEMSPATVNALRCEPSIAEIEYDQVFTIE
jgi:hypothetical protein